jgi:hypothetical protein
MKTAAEDAKVITLNAGAKENIQGDDDNDDEIDLYVKFKKPYVWECDTYEGIDLSGLENLSSQDLMDIEKKYYKLGVASFNPEQTAAYAKVTAQKASGMPIEFFEQLPLKEMLRIKNKIVSFFYN